MNKGCSSPISLPDVKSDSKSRNHKHHKVGRFIVVHFQTHLFQVLEKHVVINKRMWGRRIYRLRRALASSSSVVHHSSIFPLLFSSPPLEVVKVRISTYGNNRISTQNLGVATRVLQAAPALQRIAILLVIRGDGPEVFTAYTGWSY